MVYSHKNVYDTNFFESWTKTSILRNKKCGIGFGGKNKKDCRLWIDYDIYKNSYINHKDETY